MTSSCSNFNFDNKAILNAQIVAVGVIVQGIFFYYVNNRINKQHFAIYIILSFLAAYFNYKVFISKS